MLKIDRSVISRLDSPTEVAEGVVVSAVVDLGHALGLSVVAEGVETDNQLAHLRDLGCDGAQGIPVQRTGARVGRRGPAGDPVAVSRLRRRGAGRPGTPP